MRTHFHVSSGQCRSPAHVSVNLLALPYRPAHNIPIDGSELAWRICKPDRPHMHVSFEHNVRSSWVRRLGPFPHKVCLPMGAAGSGMCESLVPPWRLPQPFLSIRLHVDAPARAEA